MPDGRSACVGEPVGTGVALRGRVWPGGDAAPLDDAVVVVDGAGRVAALGPSASVPLPEGLLVLDGAWVGPGIVDAHVHLAFATVEDELRGGVVAVRDLGAPDAVRRADTAPLVTAWAGPLLTAPGGYPSTSWGRDGFAAFLESPQQAAALVRSLAADGVDLVKVALEPSAGPVPGPAELRAAVGAAHDAGLAVTAHALRSGAVAAALDAGVDELCHVPLELLDDALLERLVASGVPVVSSIETHGDAAARVAAQLHAAGVRLLYGTDLGNGGTRPGADSRELERLAAAGLGRLGALRAATDGAARAAGLSGVPGTLAVGERAGAVLLDDDPLERPSAWDAPVAVVAGDRLVRRR